MAVAAREVHAPLEHLGSDCHQSFVSVQTEPLNGASSGKLCKRLRSRPRLVASLVTGALLWCGITIVSYLIIPQMVIDDRLKSAHVNIGECVLEIGPNATAKISPTVGFSVSKSILQLPLVSYNAHINPFTANVYFQVDSSNVLLGTFEVAEGFEIDSSKDMNLTFAGAMTVTKPDHLARMVNLFVKSQNVTLAVSGKVDIHAKVWNWMPMPLFGITVQKSITIAGFDDFKNNAPQLDQLIAAKGSPGVLNVTASATLFNPSPVTMILKDNFQLGVLYAWKGANYKMGNLLVQAPLTIRPGHNVPMATVSVNQTSTNAEAIEAFIAEYVGPQNGFSPAGGDSKPLLVQMVDDGALTSSSLLIREATRGLSLPVDFRPKPIYFLTDITADIVALSSPVPPFYSVVLHLRVKNPMPAHVQVKKIALTAYHLNRTGTVLYHYDHDISLPKFDPAKYVLDSMENVTMDFKLNVLKEVDWGFLFRPEEIVQLLAEAAHLKMTLGISLNVTMTIDGYEQVIHYENNALSGSLCFHPVAPKGLCGGLPPNPHLGTILV